MGPVCSVPTGPEIQVPPELPPPPTPTHRAPPWGRSQWRGPTLKHSPSASSEKMAREVGYRTRIRSHRSCQVVNGQRGVSTGMQQRPGPTCCLHPPLPLAPCPPPTCDGRCCSLTLEAQMALPTTWRPHAVRSWVSLCCRLQGSSSSGGSWERGVRAGRQGGLGRGVGFPALTSGGAEWQRCSPPTRAICFSRW